MIKMSLLAALALAAFAGTAQSNPYHGYLSAERPAYEGLIEHRSASVTPPSTPPRGDYGSFSTANTAHTLGY